MNGVVDKTMCDYEYPEVSIETIRKARKKHYCQECLQIINPGDRYQYGKYLHDHIWTTHKICIDCLALSKLLLQGNECGYAFGYLFEEIINARDVQRENPNGQTIQDEGNWISNHADIEVVSQEPLLIRVKSSKT